MKLLITGGRKYTISEKGLYELDDLDEKFDFTELVNGMAKGIDRSARLWAIEYGIPIVEFWPDYDKYPSKIAPLKRNEDMVQYCLPDGICIAFPGGNGTIHCLDTAKKHKLKVIDYTNRKDFINGNN